LGDAFMVLVNQSEGLVTTGDSGTSSSADFDPASLSYTFVVPNVTAVDTVAFSLCGTYRTSAAAAKATTMQPRPSVFFIQPSDARCDSPLSDSDTETAGGASNVSPLVVALPIAGAVALLVAGGVLAWVRRDRLERHAAKGKTPVAGPRGPKDNAAGGSGSGGGGSHAAGSLSPVRRMLAALSPAAAAATALREPTVVVDAERADGASTGDEQSYSSYSGGSGGSDDAASAVVAPGGSVGGGGGSSGTSALTPSLTSGGASPASSLAAAAARDPFAVQVLEGDSDSDGVGDGESDDAGASGQKRRRRVRLVFRGAPVRDAGGPSSWGSAAAQAARAARPSRHRVVFAHSPARPDELAVARGDEVAVREFFEDGWVRVVRLVGRGAPLPPPSPVPPPPSVTPSVVGRWWEGGNRGTAATPLAAAPSAAAAGNAGEGLVPYACLLPVPDNAVVVLSPTVREQLLQSAADRAALPPPLPPPILLVH
ncbi:hypothetical protein HK405_010914, partial [Cladochytrium tenue]